MRIKHKASGVELEVKGLARFTPKEGSAWFAAGHNLDSAPKSTYSAEEWEPVPPNYLKGDFNEQKG